MLNTALDRVEAKILSVCDDIQHDKQIEDYYLEGDDCGGAGGIFYLDSLLSIRDKLKKMIYDTPRFKRINNR